MVAPPQMELPGWGVVVSVALVEVFARTGAVGSARTIGVLADTITKFKASSSEFRRVSSLPSSTQLRSHALKP